MDLSLVPSSSISPLRAIDLQSSAELSEDTLTSIVYRLGVIGGMEGLAAATWRIYQRYRVSQSMNIQYQRARRSAALLALGEPQEDVQWMQLSRYQYDLVWEGNESLSRTVGLMPLQALCTAFSAGASDAASVADHLLVAMVDAGHVDQDVLTYRFLPEPLSPSELACLADSPEASLTLLAIASFAIDSHSQRGEHWVNELAGQLEVPSALVDELRSRLLKPPVLPLAG